MIFFESIGYVKILFIFNIHIYLKYNDKSGQIKDRTK